MDLKEFYEIIRASQVRAGHIVAEFDGGDLDQNFLDTADWVKVKDALEYDERVRLDGITTSTGRRETSEFDNDIQFVRVIDTRDW